MPQVPFELPPEYLFGRPDKQALLARLELAEADVPQQVRAWLLDASARFDSELVEFALTLGFWFSMPTDIVDLVHRLVLETWHFRHEDMIRLLQEHRDPRSVAVLRDAIQLKSQLGYLDYDDYGAFYKKCLWALQSIGTSEAIDLIRLCSKSSDPVLATQAAHRLTRIQGQGPA